MTLLALILLLPAAGFTAETPVLDQLKAAAPEREPIALDKAGPAEEWSRLLVKDSVPAKEPLSGGALPPGVTPDQVSCGAKVEFPISFSQLGAGAELKLSFDAPCVYSDGGRYISAISVKAEKAFAMPFKRIDVLAELPQTSLTDCAGPGEPFTACIDLILSFNVSPFAGSWTHSTKRYTLRADGTLK
ncbi:MAG: hypothetical protein WC728_13550 [Elusimicrobiota bacterium]